MGKRHAGRSHLWPLLIAVIPLVGLQTSQAVGQIAGPRAAARPAATAVPTGDAAAPEPPAGPAWVAKIVSDMTDPNEGHPHGVPTSYSFYSGPELDAPLPGPGNTAATAWGVIYEAAGGSTATNTRVEVRNIRLYLWSRSRGRWVLYQASTSPTGEDYAEPRGSEGFTNDSSPADLRTEPGGGVSVKMQEGSWFHFWPADGRTVIDPADIGGAYTTFQARLVKDDPKGPNDTASAHYLASAGADWWANLSAPWPDNTQAFFARFTYITTSWSTWTGTTWSAAQLQANPPPTGS